VLPDPHPTLGLGRAEARQTSSGGTKTDAGEWLASPQGNNSGSHWTRGWVSLEANLDVAQEIILLGR
jgi:hypothetical protein